MRVLRGILALNEEELQPRGRVQASLDRRPRCGAESTKMPQLHPNCVHRKLHDLWRRYNRKVLNLLSDVQQRPGLLRALGRLRNACCGAGTVFEDINQKHREVPKFTNCKASTSTSHPMIGNDNTFAKRSSAAIADKNSRIRAFSTRRKGLKL
jgi:hypothetical protein